MKCDMPTITADDYGLSRGVIDTILETVDRGMVSHISVLTDGEAFDYGIEEFLKRTDRLTLAVHVNLVEGAPTADPSSVPLLVDTNGMFKYSVEGLWFAYLVSSQHAEFRRQIRHEIEAQIAKVSSALRGKASIASINGHQHVHMLPFVFDVLMEMGPLPPIRIPYERFVVPGALSLATIWKRIPGWTVLSLLCLRNRSKMSGRAFSEHFVGLLFSGRMPLAHVRASLGNLKKEAVHPDSTEVLFHPGCASEGEFGKWRTSRANVDWHFAPGRREEHDLLLSEDFAATLNEFKGGLLRDTGLDVLKIGRFIISGTAAAITLMLVLVLLTEYAGLWYVVASTIGWIAGFVVSFTLQKYWTFKDISNKKTKSKAFAYLLLQVSNLLLNALLLFLITTWFGAWYIIGQVVVLILIAVWTYFIASRIFAISK